MFSCGSEVVLLQGEGGGGGDGAAATAPHGAVFLLSSPWPPSAAAQTLHARAGQLLVGVLETAPHDESGGGRACAQWLNRPMHVGWLVKCWARLLSAAPLLLGMWPYSSAVSQEC
jgi:hypothetical protein